METLTIEDKVCTKTSTNPTRFYLLYSIVYLALQKYIEKINSLASILYLFISGITYFSGIFFFSSKNWVHISLTKIYIPEFEFQFKIQTNTTQLHICQVPLKCPLSNKSSKTCIHSFTTDLAKMLSNNLSPRPFDREASKYFKGSTFCPKQQSPEIC